MEHSGVWFIERRWRGLRIRNWVACWWFTRVGVVMFGSWWDGMVGVQGVNWIDPAYDGQNGQLRGGEEWILQGQRGFGATLPESSEQR